jgi:hypothetical protein
MMVYISRRVGLDTFRTIRPARPCRLVINGRGILPLCGVGQQQQQGSAPHFRWKHPMQINVEYEIEDLSFVPFPRRLTRPIMLHSIDQTCMQAVLWKAMQTVLQAVLLDQRYMQAVLLPRKVTKLSMSWTDLCL